MASGVPTNPVDVTLASAGTGKTTALVAAVVAAIESGKSPDRILAATFTVKAAAELTERVRAHLVAVGRLDEAVQLLGARMGTVNAVCGALVKEFAFELGRSPDVQVVDEDGARELFTAAAAGVIEAAAPALDALAEAFGLPERRVGWQDLIRQVVALARANGIAKEGLARSAENPSRASLPASRPPALHPEAELDGALRAEIELALQGLGDRALKAGSSGASEALRIAGDVVARGGDMPWPLWAKLGKPNAPKADAASFAGVARAASGHARHPRLRRDMESFVRLIFECAAMSLAAYQECKAERGLVDFGDQEALALELLQDPRNAARLREMIGAVFLDEMQDSSPIQVAIFTELARVATSFWVGDPKQAIYGFRSTDSALTLAAARGAASETGGRADVLSVSWRSRPGICALVNHAFTPAFEAMGIPKESASFSGCGRADAGSETPPLTVWHLGGRDKGRHAAAIAAGIVEALASPASWPVRDGDVTRDLRPGDVAVLCRGNDDVEAVVSALARHGVPVAVGRGKLADAAEVELALAAVRWTADRGDRLALAEMARLCGDEGAPGAWLDALGDDDPVATLVRQVPFAAALDDIRERLPGMTVGEVVETVMLASGLVDRPARGAMPPTGSNASTPSGAWRPISGGIVQASARPRRWAPSRPGSRPGAPNVREATRAGPCRS